MRITWFGHSAFKLEFADKIVLIDPFIAGAGQFKGDIAAATRGTTHIILTHGHADHVGETVEIAAATGAKLIANFELCMWLAKKGVKSVDPMNTGGMTDQNGFAVSLVQAFHSSGDEESGVWHQLGHPNGVIIEPLDGPVIYHMGDTAIFGDMALINKLYAPEIGFVPIGDRFTMGPRIAAYACREYFDFEVVVPCHYATFPLLQPNADAFEKMMEGLAGTRVQTLQPGGSFEV